jgi:hypothetical protein
MWVDASGIHQRVRLALQDAGKLLGEIFITRFETFHLV